MDVGVSVTYPAMPDQLFSNNAVVSVMQKKNCLCGRYLTKCRTVDAGCNDVACFCRH